MRNRTCYERFESTAFRTLGNVALTVTVVAILVKLARWVA
jgi:hypothetical protein